MKTALTQGDILDYIMENRRDKVFVGWSIEQILTELRHAMSEDSFLYCEDVKTKELLGVVLGRKLVDNSGNKIMHISGILATGRNVLKQFFIKFRDMYPEYKLQANRKKRFVKYSNLKRFGNLIERLS